ncbi:hypothetical protein [Streptosporangium sp. NBC_01469]|uniref:hypothetical protein n=1 Tax=Streptosporangium sp. NBC_01469 TaxID=2903898 RepID=UPI002E2E4A99|nr:hypothetical protein [Streptosporangium sp. NBC_01469]
MVATEEAGWFGVGWKDWRDLALIRARLDAGADPDAVVHYHEWPLHAAAQCGEREPGEHRPLSQGETSVFPGFLEEVR